MRQLDPHLAALVAFFDGEAKGVVGGAVVEGVVADEVGEFEDGLHAVIVGGTGGEVGAFGEAGRLVEEGVGC